MENSEYSALDILRRHKRETLLEEGWSGIMVPHLFRCRSLIDQAVLLSTNPEFLNSACRPLTATFDGEFDRNGADAAKEFVITVVQLFSLELSSHLQVDVHNVMGNMMQLEEMEFTAGLFFGIAVLNFEVFHPFMLTHYQSIVENALLENPGQHPYILGLNHLGIGQLFVLHPEIFGLFYCNNVITAESVFAIIKQPSEMSKEEEITLLFFKQFLTNAENGSLLESPERQLSYCNVTMFNIYKWLTSSSSYYMEPILISLSFVKSTAKIIPRPFVNLCFNSLILPVLSTYQEMENVCFESVNNCIAEQNGFSISHV